MQRVSRRMKTNWPLTEANTGLWFSVLQKTEAKPRTIPYRKQSLIGDPIQYNKNSLKINQKINLSHSPYPPRTAKEKLCWHLVVRRVPDKL